MLNVRRISIQRLYHSTTSSGRRANKQERHPSQLRLGSAYMPEQMTPAEAEEKAKKEELEKELEEVSQQF